MAVSIPISSTLLISTARTPLSSSLSSSNSLFFNANQSRKFLCPLRSSSRINTIRSRKGLSCNCLFGLGVPELVVIAGVAALVFGPKKLPEVGRSIGKTVKSFQQAAKEFESELKKDPESVAEVKSISNQEEEEKEKDDTKVSSSKES